jgi:hypothetical protein
MARSHKSAKGSRNLNIRHYGIISIGNFMPMINNPARAARVTSLFSWQQEIFYLFSFQMRAENKYTSPKTHRSNNQTVSSLLKCKHPISSEIYIGIQSNMIVQQRYIPYSNSKKHKFLQMFANPNTICLTIMRNTILKFAKNEKNQTAGVPNKKI